MNQPIKLGLKIDCNCGCQSRVLVATSRGQKQSTGRSESIRASCVEPNLLENKYLKRVRVAAGKRGGQPRAQGSSACRRVAKAA